MLLCLHESEEYRQDDESEGHQVVPADGLALEDRGHDDGEDGQRDGFLYNLQLHQREGAAGNLRPDAVGRYHEAVLKEGHAPRQGDDGYQRPVGDELHLLELEVAIPGECHEDVGADEQQYGQQSFRHGSPP